MSSSKFLKIILYYLMLIILAFIVNITFKILIPFIKSGYKNTYNYFQKEKIVNAKIISKRTAACKDSNNNDIEKYYLTFEDRNEKVFELQVDYYFYYYFSEHEKGILTYKGTVFINFLRKQY